MSKQLLKFKKIYMCRCSIKIKKITYPTSLNEIADILNDNILKALENFCEDEGYWLKAYFY